MISLEKLLDMEECLEEGKLGSGFEVRWREALGFGCLLKVGSMDALDSGSTKMRRWVLR